MPPKLGEKIGVFACRTPHRPNSVGISLVNVESQVDNKIYISKIDIIDGTPVLQVLDHDDSIASMPYRIPDWISCKLHVENPIIKWSPKSLISVAELIKDKKLRYYDNEKDYSQLIEEILKQNPHSIHTLNKFKQSAFIISHIWHAH